MNVDTLILSGGGTKIYGILGALEVLSEKNILNDKITKFAGTSAGSIIATLLCIGYTVKEINDNIQSIINKNTLQDSFFKLPYNFIKNWGLFTGNNLIESIKNLFLSKGYSKNTTFNDLYSKTDKILVITGTSLTTHDTFYFNVFTTPDMRIIDAIRISISIPLYFTCVKHVVNNQEHVFVDGGILNNFPLYYFDIVDKNKRYFLTQSDISNYEKTRIVPFATKANVLGIVLFDHGYTSNKSDIYDGVESINNIYSFVFLIITTMMDKLYEYNFHTPFRSNDLSDRVIYVILQEKTGMIETNMPVEKINKLKIIGRDACLKFLLNDSTYKMLEY